MTTLHLIFRSLWYYRRRNLSVALGMAIGMAVITGALVTGDSVRSGLRNLVNIRLGNADISITSGDRYLTDSLAHRISLKLGIPATAVLQIEGSVTSDGGTKRIPKVRVYGIEPSFREVVGAATFEVPANGSDAVISDNLAARLDAKEGDEILLRIKKPGPVPIDAPFVSDEENIISLSVKIKTIAGKSLHGRFHLQNTQSAPFNVFISKEQLQKLAGLDRLSNLILMAGNGKITTIQAEMALSGSRTLQDAGLHLEKHQVTGEYILRTPRVFFDLPTLSAIDRLAYKKTLWFSYFVNEFRIGDRSTPYSFVSTLPGTKILPGEIIVNRWLADDLEAHPGDSVTLSYFMVGALRNLTVEKAKFRIAAILPMEDTLCDKQLMPEIPGLSDAGNCRDWETSIPIDLSKIRDKDEEYWNRYKGVPKAFINQEVAASIWQNRFGKNTQIRFPRETSPADLESKILARLRPSDTGIMIHESAREGYAAASSGVDFSTLFLGLSFFLIAGGIILTILLIRLGIESRLHQTGTLQSLGWPVNKIRRVLYQENILVSFAGSLIGLALTFIYTILIFKALNGVWNSIVLTDTLRPLFKPGTLLLGFAISMSVSVASAWFALKRYSRRKTIALLNRNQRVENSILKRLLSASSATSGIIAIGLLGFGLIRIQSVGPTFFFAAGTMMLISLLLLATRIFRYHVSTAGKGFSLGTLSRENLWRSSSRSLSIILLFSIGIFMVIAIGANQKHVEPDNNRSLQHKRTGTGGFLFYMETTVPVPDNLNNPLVRIKYGLDTPSGFVQMKKLEGDDASCLNLNRVSNPPVIGVPAGSLSDCFTFASSVSNEFQADPWRMLEQELPGGMIPAVADQTVIQWGLGLNIGDTLKYKTENGDTVKVLLTGGLDNSIFQGNILISESHFLRCWPSVSGTNIMLISADPADSASVKSDISRVFRDYGTDLRPASEKLADFNTIENTYLSIFLVMGALAMLLGTIGLAIILVRNLQERRAEIAILRSTGFSRIRVLQLVIREYATLLIYGTLAGGIPALVAVLPGLINPASGTSVVFLIILLLSLLVNGLFWIILLGWIAIRKPGIVQSLRNE